MIAIFFMIFTLSFGLIICCSLNDNGYGD